MANQSLKLKPIAPLSNAVRTGKPQELAMTQIRISEALDLLNQNLLAVAARLPQDAAVVTTIIQQPEPIVLTAPATTISSPIPVTNGYLMVLQIVQDATGGRLFVFSSIEFGLAPVEISQEPNARAVYLFIGAGGIWVFLSVANQQV